MASPEEASFAFEGVWLRRCAFSHFLEFLESYRPKEESCNRKLQEMLGPEARRAALTFLKELNPMEFKARFLEITQNTVQCVINEFFREMTSKSFQIGRRTTTKNPQKPHPRSHPRSLVEKAIEFRSEQLAAQTLTTIKKKGRKKVKAKRKPKARKSVSVGVDSGNKSIYLDDPISLSRRLSKKAGSDGELIRCSCGNHVEEGTMVMCDNCEVWQHQACSPFPNKLPEVYFCDLCDSKLNDRRQFCPDAIVEQQGMMVLVHWAGYPDRFNTWREIETLPEGTCQLNESK